MFLKRFLIISLVFCTVFCSFAEDGQMLDTLQKRASKGDIAAQLELAKEYFKGVKRPMNRALAIYYFKLAADAGSPEGMFNLGMCHEYGVEFAPDKLAAYEYYAKAGDFPPALFKKAVFLENGIPPVKTSRTYRKGIRADKTLSKNIISDLIKQEYPPALTYQAKKYIQSSKSTETEFKEAFRLLSIAIQKNDISAYLLLADCFQWGLGCEKNEKKAFQLISHAAAQGDGASAAKLAIFYEYGIGTAPDLNKAVEFYQKAAKLGEPSAMVQLAKHYSSGFILETDLAKAIQLAEDALSLNEKSAFTLLGIFNQRGIGMKKDSKKAFQLFLKGASMGDPEAQYHLALAFKNGNGTPTDEKGALYWMQRAAAIHYSPAVETLKSWKKK